MDHEERNLKSKGYTNFRGSLHIGLGALYLAIGGAVLKTKHFGYMELSSAAAYIFGALLLLYGIFRVWRGWTYMRNRR